MRRRTTAALIVVGSGVLGLVAAAIGGSVRADVPWAVTVPAGVALGALLAAMLWLPPADDVVTAAVPPFVPPEAESFGDLASLRFVVEQAGRDAERFETRLRPRLATLVMERLWQRHRVDWRTDTGRAEALHLLSPDLLALMTAPPTSLRLTPRTLGGWLHELEEL